MNPRLPSVGVESYKDPHLYPIPSPDDLAAYLATVEDHYRQADLAEKANAPMIIEEQQALCGLLSYIDYCLPVTEHRFNRLTDITNIKRSRAVASVILGIVPEVEMDADDLLQSQRLHAIRMLRVFEAGRGFPVFALLTRSMTNQTRLSGINALRLGLTYQRKIAGTRPYIKVLEDVTNTRSELGYSDEIAIMQSHPKYITKEPLSSKPPVEDIDTEHLPFDQRPEELVNDMEDHEAADWLALVDLPRTATIDRLLDRVEEFMHLTDRRRRILKLYFEDGLNATQIAQMPEFECSNQAISFSIRTSLAKIFSVSDRAGLHELYR